VKLGVVTFPGTCDDTDARLAAAKVAQEPRPAGVDELRALLGDAWQGRRPSPA
jgi:hypothetical protein